MVIMTTVEQMCVALGNEGHVNVIVLIGIFLQKSLQ